MAETVMPSNVQQDRVVNNLTTTAAGYVLDARQGKALSDQIAEKASVKSFGSINNTSVNSMTIQNAGTTVRGLLIGSSSDSTRTFVCVVAIAKNTQTSYKTEIFKGSSITITSSTSGITISTSANYGTAVYLLAVAGDVNDLSAN